MIFAFYVASAVAVFATAMVVTRRSAVHALLYLVVSLLSTAVVFLVLGAPLAAAFEVMIYAGAIMVLFVFVVMMITVGGVRGRRQEKARSWWGPAILTGVLAFEVIYLLLRMPQSAAGGGAVPAEQVGTVLLGPYVLAVELVSMLLLIGLAGAYHLAHDLRRRDPVMTTGGCCQKFERKGER